MSSYWPEDTETCFYITGKNSFSDILERAQDKWPGIRPDEILIEPEHTQTRSLGYDLYDSTDYTNFDCITASKDYFERVRSTQEK